MIVRIEHAAHERHRVDDLAALVEVRLALDHVRDARLAERLEHGLEGRGDAQQDRDLVERDACGAELRDVARHGARLALGERPRARREASSAPLAGSVRAGSQCSTAARPPAA